MILSEIRLVIGIHLGMKGMPPTIIAPVLNILAGIDNELSITGWDFSSPEIGREIQRLKEAIILWNSSDISAESVNMEDLPDEPPLIIPDDEDELAFLDNLDQN